MRKSVMVCLIVAAALVVVGLALFALGISLNGGFSDFDMQTYTHEITEEFNDISVKAATADIRFVYTKDSVCKIECYENPGREQHVVSVKDGVLTIERVDQRRWYQKMIDFGKMPSVTVYLPEQAFGDLSVGLSTGDVTIERELSFKNITVDGSTSDVTCHASAEEAIKVALSTGDLEMKGNGAKTVELSVTTGEIEVSSLTCTDLSIRVSTGNAELSDVTCKNLTSRGSTGDLELERVSAEEFSIERSTGDVELERCEAQKIWIKTDTGDVRGTLLNDMVFYVTTDTGRVRVPKNTTGGLCEITTDTGNVTFDVVGK